MKHLDITISGHVQGVFFRGAAKQKAEELEIDGFIRNEPDGSIYIEAEGNEKNLEEFINWCKKGPQGAKVENIETEETSLKNFHEFTIV